MPRIVVLDGYNINPGDNSWAPLEALGDLTVFERTERAAVVERARGADVILTNKAWIDASAIAELPELRGICVLATGYNVVDVAAARARRIPVCNVPGYSTASVVEHTFALLFELTRAVGAHDRAVHAGEWSRSADFCFWKSEQRELAGTTFGVIGYGEIGRRVARVAAALDFRVLATRSRSAAAEPGVTVAELPQMFAEADVISLHCPLTPETAGLIAWPTLSRMKRSALLVNTARGALIVEADLARALREQRIAGAALDVLSAEPPSDDNPLLSAPRCIITPHLAWSTLAARQRLLALSAENVRGILAGRPIHVVNP